MFPTCDLFPVSFTIGHFPPLPVVLRHALLRGDGAAVTSAGTAESIKEDVSALGSVGTTVAADDDAAAVRTAEAASPLVLSGPLLRDVFGLTTCVLLLPVQLSMLCP